MWVGNPCAVGREWVGRNLHPKLHGATNVSLNSTETVNGSLHEAKRVPASHAVEVRTVACASHSRPTPDPLQTHDPPVETSFLPPATTRCRGKIASGGHRPTQHTQQTRSRKQGILGSLTERVTEHSDSWTPTVLLIMLVHLQTLQLPPLPTPPSCVELPQLKAHGHTDCQATAPFTHNVHPEDKATAESRTPVTPACAWPTDSVVSGWLLARQAASPPNRSKGGTSQPVSPASNPEPTSRPPRANCVNNLQGPASNPDPLPCSPPPACPTDSAFTSVGTPPLQDVRGPSTNTLPPPSRAQKSDGVARRRRPCPTPRTPIRTTTEAATARSKARTARRLARSGPHRRAA